MAFVEGKKLAPEYERVCILYDPSDGHVVHRHTFTKFAGGKDMSEKEVEGRALEIARKRGHDVGKLKALHVSPTEHSNAKNYRIDTKSLRLVEIPFAPTP